MQYGRKYCTTIQREGATSAIDVVVQRWSNEDKFPIKFFYDFSLTICLWVISWTHFQFRSSEAKELGPKMTCEICVVVWDNGRRNAMKTEYLVHENLCDWGGSIWMDESTKMTIFGDSINHNQDYGLPSRFREPDNEIHWNICPNPCVDGKRFEKS